MNNYWADRFAKEEDFINNLSLKKIDIAKKEYDRAYREVNRTISTWYSKYAKNNNLSIAEASKLLNSKELKEHRMSLEEYIEKGRSLNINRDDKIVKQLELASARVHLDRLESLRHEIKAEIDLMTKKVETSIKEHLTKVIDDGYFKSAYHLRGVADIERLNPNLIEKIIYKPWTSDNKNWSKRLWGHDNRLVNVLHQGLIQNMVSGKSLNKIIETVAERFNAETSIAARLILTESAAYHSLAKVECFKDLDVEKYEIVATLDSRTSPKCQSMDGKIIDMKLYQVGVTAPPFHCRCRSTTAPYYEDIEGDVNTRAARTLKGKHELVDDVSYPEWRKSLIKSHGKEAVELHGLKVKDEVRDFNKYQDYKPVIPSKFMPKSFDNYQEMKYNNTEEYKNLKVRHKILTEYDLKIHEGRQGKHILGHNNYKGKSYLFESINPQEFINRYAGTEEIRRNKKSGTWIRKGFITHDKDIGYVVHTKTGKKLLTNRFAIHYSKRGVHIVPVKKE